MPPAGNFSFLRNRSFQTQKNAVWRLLFLTQSCTEDAQRATEFGKTG